MKGKEIITVLPGDDVTSHITLPCKLGTGLHSSVDTSKNTVSDIGDSHSGVNDGSCASIRIKAELAGRLRHRSASNTYFILANTRRYVPKINDRVLVIVEERVGDYHRVTMPQSTCGPALLPTLAFEGATKRNHPNLSTGSLIYCRVTSCDSHFETLLSCLVGNNDGGHNSNKNTGGFPDGGASRKDWMTDEGTYGELKGGSVTIVSIGLAKELLHPKNVVLDALGNAGLPFEICIGVNGMIWIHSTRPEYTILILNAIRNSEVMTEAQVKGMVKAIVKTVKRQIMDEEE
mmetsp:Transcript_17309/g.24444  ORF Transcript_17309/g.24444 Transcript_17309/m.24444 type:complete len:290 (-) Transcript_17309:124-993(-)|eukprot:CAMPEP_0184864490 /NCGR_PEP_ID=MMETSP0580-20130426/15174_1 /TAXON_ID=1118495 /ORGANISM="Dactyliosolen fragilissimus" /LENGTH=289 /DNA_ID=CAMNT_0027363309 /DNA_START=90 /DNA_END=959 /DNA_ORIENTATION=-